MPFPDSAVQKYSSYISCRNLDNFQKVKTCCPVLSIRTCPLSTYLPRRNTRNVAQHTLIKLSLSFLWRLWSSRTHPAGSRLSPRTAKRTWTDRQTHRTATEAVGGETSDLPHSSRRHRLSLPISPPYLHPSPQFCRPHYRPPCASFPPETKEGAGQRTSRGESETTQLHRCATQDPCHVPRALCLGPVNLHTRVTEMVRGT